jgi:DeoR family fructose operon transcriptional repressor
VDQKKAIAAKALEYIRPGNVIALDSGTTTFELAKLLGDIPNLTVITNDLKIAMLLEQNDSITVILLGGMLRPKFHCTIGSSVLTALDSLYIDTAFLGTNGVSLRRGFSTPRIETADIKRKLISIAGNVIVLSDSSKVNNEAFAAFAALDDVNTLIADGAMDPGFVADAKALGLSVQLVDKNE